MEEWVTNRFGQRLYKTFFKTYTEKVWGIPCTEIQAEWAAQRIKGLSLKTAIINALLKTNNTKTLIKEFDYPVLGPGMMWQRFQQAVESKGGEVQLNTGVVRLEREGRQIKRIITRRDGKLVSISGEQFVSACP